MCWLQSLGEPRHTGIRHVLHLAEFLSAMTLVRAINREEHQSAFRYGICHRRLLLEMLKRE
jgi:hypothetical protein